MKIVKKDQFILSLLVLFIPIVLLNGFSLITNETLLAGVKIFLFAIAFFLIKYNSLNIKNKLNVIILLFSLEILTVTIINQNILNISYAILYISPFYLLVMKNKSIFILNKLEIRYLLLVLVFSFLFVLFSPKIVFAGRDIFTPIINGPHTTTYSIIIIYFFIYIGYINNLIGKYTFIFATLVSLIIVFGYKARNAELALVLFFLTYYFYENRFDKSLRYTIIYVSLLLLFITFYMINDMYTPDWNEVSSGRIDVWLERIQILMNYDFEKLFFGGGYGADLIYTKMWWWEKKASHNDFISLVFNSGLLSFLMFILIVTYLFKSGNSFQKGLVLFLVTTSATNTGFLGRPIQFFYLVLVYLLANSLNSKVKRDYA